MSCYFRWAQVAQASNEIPLSSYRWSVLSWILDLCTAVWSGAAKKDISKLQLVQMYMECECKWPACQSLWAQSWGEIDCFTIGLCVRCWCVEGPELSVQAVGTQFGNSSEQQRHATRGLFTVSRSRTVAGKHTVLNKFMSKGNSITPGNSS